MRILLLSLLLAAAAVNAEPVRYITDQLEITLRSGQSTRHQILRMVTSGTPVEVMEQNEESGYARVKMPDGTEGWVLSRYLDAQPSGRARLAKARDEMAELRNRLERLQTENSELREQNNDLNSRLTELTGAKDRLEQEVTRIRRASSSALAIDEENRKLKTRLQRLERDYQVLQQDNEVLKDHTARDWFIVGAGVVLVGIAIGLLIPKIRWRKQSDWNRF